MDKNESTPQPLGERSDEDLVQLALELYARTCAHPSSKELHESAFAARDELVKRLRSVAGGAPKEFSADEVYVIDADGKCTPEVAGGEPEQPLTFNEFQTVNKHRCETKFHQCGDWLPTGWPLAIAGEAGELCNLIKKVVRGDFTFEEKRADILKELADVIIYCDLMITAMGANTGQTVAAKFDEVSGRVGYTDRKLALPAPPQGKEQK